MNSYAFNLSAIFKLENHLYFGLVFIDLGLDACIRTPNLKLCLS